MHIRLGILQNGPGRQNVAIDRTIQVLRLLTMQ